MDPEARSERSGRPAQDEAVLIRVPADPDYLAIIRSASAYVATRIGCTLPEVADLRLAVDEAGGLLLRHTVREEPAGAVGDLECRFVLGDSALSVRLSLEAEDATRPDTEEFGWTILSALVDDIVWRVEGSTVGVEVLKRRVAGR